MAGQKVSKIVFSLVMVGLLVALAATEARAVPSFHRQTGQDCYACHTVFPELTPMGRAFKLTGYVLNKKGEKCPPYPAVSAMATTSYTHLNTRLPSELGISYPQDTWSRHALSSNNDLIVSPPNNDNDVVSSPELFTFLYGGQIYDKVGAFVEGTYANTTSKDGFPVAMGNSDVRYANSAQLFDKDLIFGITVNNDPTVEDVWNTTPAFSFPYVSSNFAVVPPGPLIAGLGAQVGGAGLYAYWNNSIYALISVYRTSENGITYPFGAGTHPLGVQVDGALPYWRIAFTHQYGAHSIEVGTFGLVADTFPGNPPPSGISYIRSGPTDHFEDIAVDAQYQYIQGRHAFSVQTAWIHERQDRSGSFANGFSANTTDSLNLFKINGNYYYRSQKCGTLGGSVGVFSVAGDMDTGLYGSGAPVGSLSGSPDSNGITFEIDYLPPWKKYIYPKLSLQYVIYNRFNGAGSNYDGFGRNASDNNTLYLLLWTAF